MRENVDVDAVAATYDGARGLLLDTFSTATRGGTGVAFHWTRARRATPMPIILAGGLSVDNVAAAIAAVQPFAVDVNSGVEASPGIKDAQKIKEFVKEVERVQAAQH